MSICFTEYVFLFLVESGTDSLLDWEVGRFVRGDDFRFELADNRSQAERIRSLDSSSGR